LQAALGAPAQIAQGLTLAAAQTGPQLQTLAPHGLAVGSAVSSGDEIRFVAAVLDPSTVVLNVPFSAALDANTVLAPAITYMLSTTLPSLTLYDYWDPTTATSRMVTGAAVVCFPSADQRRLSRIFVQRPGRRSARFLQLRAGYRRIEHLSPRAGARHLRLLHCTGHLGQVWLGSAMNQYFTLDASKYRDQEQPCGKGPGVWLLLSAGSGAGPREVITKFTLFAQDDTQTKDLYAAAKQRTQISAMFAARAEARPNHGYPSCRALPRKFQITTDSETRLLWEFKNNLGQGVSNDEAFIAFCVNERLLEPVVARESDAEGRALRDETHFTCSAD